MQHVATWKEGDEKWAYHEDAFKHIATHKVSLDPYRQESRRILACIKEVLPAPPLQKVEKASVDEVFLDLSAQIQSMLLERYPELSGPPPYDDPTERLPKPPISALDWNTDAVVDLDSSETEDDDPDWDDIAMSIGSDIVRKVRAAIRERLKYTCSAGIARNKMISKLGSGHKKPNQQTVVRNRAVQHFLSEFKFTKIRNLGGKLGDEVVAKFNTDQVSELLQTPLDQMKSRLGDDTGSWVYHIIRGEDTSDINARTQIKSMLSAKSFRPTINSTEQAIRWLRIFVADIMSRLIEEGVLENKRRPRTINLHHRQGAQMRSRQAPIPTGRAIDETLLFDIAKGLLAQVEIDGRAWPCSNLQLSVGGFEDGPTGNKGIGGFLVRGDEAKALAVSHSPILDDPEQPPKRRKIQDAGIQYFFSSADHGREDSGKSSDPDEIVDQDGHESTPIPDSNTDAFEHLNSREGKHAEDTEAPPISATHTQHQTKISSYFCSECKASIAETERGEHEDWHFAKSLQAQEANHPPDTDSLQEHNASSKPHGATASKSVGRPKSNGVPFQKNMEKGQKKLAFG